MIFRHLFGSFALDTTRKLEYKKTNEQLTILCPC